MLNPWSGIKEAKAALESSKADEPSNKKLAEDLHRIEKENHIAARVHAAFRGE